MLRPSLGQHRPCQGGLLESSAFTPWGTSLDRPAFRRVGRTGTAPGGLAPRRTRVRSRGPRGCPGSPPARTKRRGHNPPDVGLKVGLLVTPSATPSPRLSQPRASSCSLGMRCSRQGSPGTPMGCFCPWSYSCVLGACVPRSCADTGHLAPTTRLARETPVLPVALGGYPGRSERSAAGQTSDRRGVPAKRGDVFPR